VPLSFKGVDVELSIFSVFLLPGEELSVTVNRGKSGALAVKADFMPDALLSGPHWNLRAPSASGIYPMEIGSADGSFHTRLNLIVLTPFSRIEQGLLNGYRIGNYPSPHPNRSAFYPRPTGFVEVTEANRNTRVSPHFSLGQFLCKQESAYPKYLVLQEKLLVLLESLLREVRAEGYDIDTFGFISGYRTPWYNRSIGNVKYSRHVYGDAADIFIDTDGDGHLDDLNGDGVQDRKDAARFFDIVDRFMTRGAQNKYSGGVGLYQRNARRTGFVHVDTRGYGARW
jgi:hypothetical protein